MEPSLSLNRHHPSLIKQSALFQSLWGYFHHNNVTLWVFDILRLSELMTTFVLFPTTELCLAPGVMQAVLASLQRISCCWSWDIIFVYEEKEKLAHSKQKVILSHTPPATRMMMKSWQKRERVLKIFVEPSQNPSQPTSFKAVSVCELTVWAPQCHSASLAELIS